MLANGDSTQSWRAEEAPAEDEFGHVERRMIEDGKREHRETTETARRALQVAEQTADIASATLVEVQRQGTALRKTDAGMTDLERDVEEASRLVKFMRRFCCFQILCCCDCFDPDVKDDRTRRKRLKEREMNRALFESSITLEQASKQEALSRIHTRSDPAYNNDERAARAELFGTRQRQDPGLQDGSLGHGLPTADRADLQEQTDEQDQIIERIGTTVDTLRIMSLELQGELESQTPVIDGLQDRTLNTHNNLATLAQAARKV